MCKTNKSKVLAGRIKGIILGPQLLSFYKLSLIQDRIRMCQTNK